MKIHAPPNHIERIETLWAVLSVDETGEGVCGATLWNGIAFPLITADEKLLREKMLPMAAEIAAMSGKKLKLVKFTTRTEIEDIKP